MEEFEIVTEIDRPAADVFGVLQDFEKFPNWNPQIISARLEGDPPLRIGSKVVFTGKFLGRSYESSAEYFQYQANEKLASKTTSGPFHLEVAHTLEPIDAGTRLTTVYRGESRGFFKLAEPVVVRLARKQFENAAENLKALLEADAL